MEISVDELLTYYQCSLKHHYQYRAELPYAPSEHTRFGEAMHRTIYSFFYHLMNGQQLGEKDMRRKWESVGATMIDSEADNMFAVRDHPKHRSQANVRALDMIHHFYRYNAKNPGVPIVVDEGFRLPIAGVTLTGTFELIREIEDPAEQTRFVEIVDFKTNSQEPHWFQVKNDLRLTIMSMAFRHMFRSNEDRIKYHFLKSGRDIITYRTEQDFARVERIVRDVVAGIQNERILPEQDPITCRACPFQEACDMETFA